MIVELLGGSPILIQVDSNAFNFPQALKNHKGHLKFCREPLNSWVWIMTHTLSLTLYSYSVWPDLAKFCHLGKLSKVLGKLLRFYLVFGKILNQLWQHFMNFGQIWAFVSSQMMKNILAIWSHCSHLPFICQMFFSFKLKRFKLWTRKMKAK